MIFGVAGFNGCGIKADIQHGAVGAGGSWGLGRSQASNTNLRPDEGLKIKCYLLGGGGMVRNIIEARTRTHNIYIYIYVCVCACACV